MTTDERLLELLVERRERPLDPRELAELRERLGATPGWREDDLELAEAALWASVDAPPMTERARDRAMSTLPPLASEARPDLAQTLRVESAASPGATLPIPRSTRPLEAVPSPSTTLPIPPRAAERSRGPQLGRRAAAGWIAAALAAGVALFGWWPRPSPSVAAQRAQLLARADVRRIEWTAAGDPLVKTIAGDVVWDGAAQAGVMRFVGLPRNDPAQHQYQLWIFDAARDERYPVDGGVFDVAADGEALVAIVPKIRVDTPTLFAVTLEKPGGVVVSSRERLLTLAKVM